MKNPRILTIILAALCLFSGCQKESSASSSEQTIPYVRVIFGFAGLGDRCYNDVIFTGVWATKFKHGEDKVDIDVFCPENMEETESLVRDWYDHPVSERQLLILCSPNYDSIFDNHPEWKSTPGKDVFLLDYDRPDMDINSWYISLYGVSHFAGQLIKVAGNDALAIVLANRNDINIAEAFDGMTDGFRLAGGEIDEEKDVYYLSDESGNGYNSADSLYRLSTELDRKGYDFVAPIAGGSGLGAFRYTRMNYPINPKGMFATCGYDIDQQDYSNRVAFSVLKRMDLAICEYIDNWIEGKEQTKYRYLGLDSDFVGVLFSDALKAQYELPKQQYESLKQLSIAAEQEYKLSHAKIH